MLPLISVVTKIRTLGFASLTCRHQNNLAFLRAARSVLLGRGALRSQAACGQQLSWLASRLSVWNGDLLRGLYLLFSTAALRALINMRSLRLGCHSHCPSHRDGAHPRVYNCGVET